MRKIQKVSLLLGFMLALSMFSCTVSVSGDKAGESQVSVNDVVNGNAVPEVSPQVMIQRLGKGINMGNTLDAPTEGAWAKPAQEYYFDDYKAAGFNSVRIPVTWHRHLSETAPYTVDPVFMSRVEQIVDWALARNLAVVLNCHHEDWIRTNYPATQVPRLESLWDQIATKFANKSENLVFEVMNEPFGPITTDQVTDMNARIVKIIRKTNPTRNIIIGGAGWNSSWHLVNAMVVPNDTHLIGNFHYYAPFDFCGKSIGTWGTAQDIAKMTEDFKKVKDWSVQTNIPVFLGEFGVRKEGDTTSRIAYYKNISALARANGFAYTVWDDSGSFSVYNRSARTWDTPILNELIGSLDNNAGPAGYTFCANEGQSYTFSQTVDVAYGVNGKFNYRAGVTGTVTFNNATFGDPIPGVMKKGYYKIVSTSSRSSSSVSSVRSSSSALSSQSSSSLSSKSSVTSSSSSSANGVVVTLPFVKEGKGEFWYKTSQTPNYMNSWNLDVLEVNGVSLLNVWVSGANLPAKQNGYYNIRYKGSYDWSHFEAR